LIDRDVDGGKRRQDEPDDEEVINGLDNHPLSGIEIDDSYLGRPVAVFQDTAGVDRRAFLVAPTAAIAVYENLKHSER